MKLNKLHEAEEDFEDVWEGDFISPDFAILIRIILPRLRSIPGHKSTNNFPDELGGQSLTWFERGIQVNLLCNVDQELIKLFAFKSRSVHKSYSFPEDVDMKLLSNEIMNDIEEFLDEA